MAYSPLAIANEFVKLSQRTGQPVDHMKLQKLVHFVHGYGLATGDRVVSEDPQVWKFGPVFPSLYRELKYHGSDTIKEPEMSPFFGPPPGVPANDERTNDLIQKVWKKYGVMTSFTLSNLTHKVDSPWYQVVMQYHGEVPKGTKIPENIIKQHYEALPALG